MHIQYQGIKVLGPNFDISPVTGVRRAEASVNPLGASVAGGLADHISFTDTSSDSTFSGFEITGNSVSDKNAAVIMAGGFATHGGGDNMTISRNYIHDTNTPGIAITGAFFGNLTISDNKIVNTKLVTAWGGTYSAAIGANAIAATTTPWLITGNYISNSEGQGISAMHNLGVSITNNTILNTQMAGIDAPTGWSAARTFQSTIVSNNTIINANLAASATSGGIVVGAATNTYWDSYSFSGNTIINSSPGFYISASIGDLSTKLSFTNNRISGYGTTAIKHETAGTLNAANNWFGGVCEASIFSATGDGTVSFSPCLNP
jgi:hypothetical protein